MWDVFCDTVYSVHLPVSHLKTGIQGPSNITSHICSTIRWDRPCAAAMRPNVKLPWPLVSIVLEQCNPWPHVANRHISISQLLLLWCHSYYDVSRLRRSQPRSQWRHSHCDVIHYWAGHAHRYGRPYVTDILPGLTYKDYLHRKNYYENY